MYYIYNEVFKDKPGQIGEDPPPPDTRAKIFLLNCFESLTLKKVKNNGEREREIG